VRQHGPDTLGTALVNGIEGDAVSVLDRGLAYGDGVFRTLRVLDGRPFLWSRQYAKLAADCAALKLSVPARPLLEREVSHIAAHIPDAIVKIIVTRGAAARGYAIPRAAKPHRILISAPLAHRRGPVSGVEVLLCETRLALQPRLAGIKHLNRLENVLARSEWREPAIAEGLLRDIEGNVISGTMSNLFLVRGGRLLTPELTRCGVAGVQRARIIELARRHKMPLQIGRLGIEDVYAADEVFLVNSVIGLWPVIKLGRKKWKAGETAAEIRQWLKQDERD
jgi:4-amino-4-deoxychorismate lyase